MTWNTSNCCGGNQKNRIKTLKRGLKRGVRPAVMIASLIKMKCHILTTPTEHVYLSVGEALFIRVYTCQDSKGSASRSEETLSFCFAEPQNHVFPIRVTKIWSTHNQDR